MDHTEWLLWRHGGIGGSDAPIIMGVSPYKTALQLYEEKILPAPPPQKPNFVADRGTRMEPGIRALVSVKYEQEFYTDLMVAEEIPFLRCSLDGRNSDLSIILQIKTCGKEDFELAKAGKLPEKYIPQVQHELFVTGAEKLIYVAYYDPEWKEDEIRLENMAFVDVFPDQEYMLKLVEAESKFWQDHVMKRKPVPASDRDYKTIQGAAKLANKFKQLKLKAEKIEAEMEEVRGALIIMASSSGHPRLKVCGLRIQQVSKAGSVEYSKVPQLKGVDLEPYRKSGTTYWKVEVSE